MIFEEFKNNFGRYGLKNVYLKDHTTFQIGGKTGYFIKAINEDILIRAIKFFNSYQMPWIVIGGGSNLLFDDKGINGGIIQNQNQGIDVHGRYLTIKSGTVLNELVNKSAEFRLSGIEFAAGIPGSIGGAVWGNAGAWGKSLSDIVKSVTTINDKCEKRRYMKSELNFSYRNSSFKDSNEIIIEIELELVEGDKNKIRQEIENIISQREKKLPKQPSAGSVFKNPSVFKDGKRMSAGWYIEQSGLKGLKVGGVQIFSGHANIIINVDNGTAGDVIKLMNIVMEKVKQNFNLTLEPEIIYINNTCKRQQIVLY